MRRHAVLLAAVALASCATIDEGVDKGAEVLSEALLPTSSEIALGNQLADQVEGQEPVLRNPEVQAYVARLGQRLARESQHDRKGIDYEFTVIDQPDQVNAFALPGGHIYVYSGLIRAVDSEAELAAVIGHEVAHVTSRHGAEALVKAVGLETIASLALGEKPGMVAQLAAGIAAQGFMARHSRAAESEADRRGLDYLVRAGYDPDAMATVFQKLAKLGGSRPSALEAFFASHPDPLERSKVAQAAIRKRGLSGGKTSIVGDIRAIQAELGAHPAAKAAEKEPAEKPAEKRSGGSTGSSAPPPAKK